MIVIMYCFTVSFLTMPSDIKKSGTREYNDWMNRKPMEQKKTN